MEVDVYLYPYSREEAKRLKQLELWRESNRANVICKKAIEEAIRGNFDGTHLNADCARDVIAVFGFKRVNWVLANTIQQKDCDGQFSNDNMEWAKRTDIPPDKDGHNLNFVVGGDPAALDNFINQFRHAYQELGLFDRAHCEPETNKQDFEGKVVVLSPGILKETCWTPQDQLWLATGGFGCRHDSSGRAVFATCLADGEETRWNRSQFIGILRDDAMPEWAREKLAEIQAAKQEQTDAPSMGGGMNMT
ncbi:MAG: DUF3849 domain-containing protein [Oscillospiraceae bacterium]|nr:DUF3849 domain-containing protein [Oscillospiraceae bacterium]